MRLAVSGWTVLGWVLMGGVPYPDLNKRDASASDPPNALSDIYIIPGSLKAFR